jgi:hypothetical protein
MSLTISCMTNTRAQEAMCLKQIAAVGDGGLEFLPFYYYGLGPAVTDWSICEVGIDLSIRVFYVALNTSDALNFFLTSLLAQIKVLVCRRWQRPWLRHGTRLQKHNNPIWRSLSGKVSELVVEFNQLTWIVDPTEPWGSNERRRENFCLNSTQCSILTLCSRREIFDRLNEPCVPDVKKVSSSDTLDAISTVTRASILSAASVMAEKSDIDDQNATCCGQDTRSRHGRNCVQCVGAAHLLDTGHTNAIVICHSIQSGRGWLVRYHFLGRL